MIFKLDHTPCGIIGNCILTSGYFALGPHVGHIEYLQFAAKLRTYNHGKYRHVVAINGDQATISKYGYLPIPAKDRAIVIHALSCVDDVFIYDEDNVAYPIRTLQPKLFINAGDRGQSNANKEEMQECMNTDCIPIWAGLRKIESTHNLIENIALSHKIHQ